MTEDRHIDFDKIPYRISHNDDKYFKLEDIYKIYPHTVVLEPILMKNEI